MGPLVRNGEAKMDSNGIQKTIPFRHHLEPEKYLKSNRLILFMIFPSFTILSGPASPHLLLGNLPTSKQRGHAGTQFLPGSSPTTVC